AAHRPGNAASGSGASQPDGKNQLWSDRLSSWRQPWLERRNAAEGGDFSRRPSPPDFGGGPTHRDSGGGHREKSLVANSGADSLGVLPERRAQVWRRTHRIGAR